MIHLVLVWLLAHGPVRPRAVAGTQIYQVELRPERLDYALAPPRPGPCRIRLTGRAAPKSKLVFLTPLQPGSYALDIQPTLASERTIVFSVPLQGASSFEVTAGGDARYDFSFRMPGGKEYRFTFTAPVDRKTFRLAP